MSVSRSPSKPGIPTKKPQADGHINEIKPKPTTKTYYRVTVPNSGTLKAGEVVIKLDGIVARPTDAQCQDERARLSTAAPQRRRR